MSKQAEYYAEPVGRNSDGWLVKQSGVGIVCECFDDTGEEAKLIATLLNKHYAAQADGGAA